MDTWDKFPPSLLLAVRCSLILTMGWIAKLLVTSLLSSAPSNTKVSCRHGSKLSNDPYFGLPSQRLKDKEASNQDDDTLQDPDPVSFSVCLSPGCLADGSQSSLDKLQALAPAHVDVSGGPCRSFCGSGPVVLEDSSTGPNKKMKTIPHKRISADDKILKLLFPEYDEPPKSVAKILQGYNLGIAGDEAFEKKDYQEAIRFYESAVDLAFRAATDLQNDRDHYKQKFSVIAPSSSRSRESNKSHRRTPTGLEWLVRLRRQEALAKIELGDLDGAMLSIQASCNMSRNTSARSIVVLAKIYQGKNDAAGELTALKNLFELPVDDSKLSFAEKNDRRLAEIRMQKLQFQMKA